MDKFEGAKQMEEEIINNFKNEFKKKVEIKCLNYEPHNYIPLGSPHINKTGDLIQVSLCSKCGNATKAVISSKEDIA